MTSRLSLPLTDTRRSGRTTRMLLKALSLAGEDERVIVLGHTADYAQALRNRILGMADALGLKYCKSEEAVCAVNIQGTNFVFYGQKAFNRRVPPVIQKHLTLHVDHFCEVDW